MTVALEIPYTRSSGYRPHGAPRWHRIRSGSFHPGSWHDLWPRDVTCWTYWCGQTQSDGREPRNGHTPGILTSDTLPDDGVPLCGACEGRAIGAGHPPLAVAVTQPGRLLFEPTRLTPPRLCPASQLRYGTNLVVDHGRTAHCLVCGETVRWWGAHLRRHAPGPGLVPGCEFHLWNDLVLASDGVRQVVACRCMTTATDPPW